ncbi:hypothetical protein [Bradyrhizobium sp. WSM471]|uniref:hypothetical protein n=1 Tax=Bradyrhizobium sp. WSM471 TaxID=319017 RepID=UPI00024D2259|nr:MULTISPECIES: hypothetical protein [Bradyrhizobium]EHR01387.1 hypothetical protein Bra471DRAFT_02108 [Bradyrhizobium sp. WSM471]UFW43451.1 hypothetical protein BcanWSM471_10365 [Bradyrhizobium canariense]
MNSFPQRAVGVTLTGEEWTTILMVITRGQDSLSRHGCSVYGRAVERLAAQVCTASDQHASGLTPGLRLVGAE